MADRRERLLALHDDRVYGFLRRLPPPLNHLSLATDTYGSSESGNVETETLSSSPAAALAPWWFWEPFSSLDDEAFLAIAEAGASIHLASIVLDFLVDGQLADDPAAALLHKALFDHGVSIFGRIYSPTSAFWSRFDDLNAAHVAGLAAELEFQRQGRALSHDAFISMTEAKVCAGILTIAALVEATEQPQLLEPISSCLKHMAVASQLLDDVQDWQADLEDRHRTYFLSCLAPPGDSTQSVWPSSDDLRTRIDESWLDTDHLRRAIQHLDQAILDLRDIYAPAWSDHTHAKRLTAEHNFTVALARHMTSAIGKSAPGEASGTRRWPSSAPRFRMPGKIPGRITNHPLGRAVAAALEFVLAAQRPDGSWVDFELPKIGASDSWVTAHLGYRLAGLPPAWKSQQVDEALHRAATFMMTKWRHGWGYSDLAPVDADSTAHGILFFNAISDACPNSTIDALLAFQQPDGGFSTYIPGRGDPVPDSWYVSHPDVTPVALSALAPLRRKGSLEDVFERALPHMEADRLADDSLPAFWWDLRWYTMSAWANLYRILASTAPPVYRAREQEGEDLGCLDAALCLEFTQQTENDETSRRVAAYLLQVQLGEGHWPVRPVMRFPEEGIERPWEVDDAGSLYADVRGVYSTATILSSLAHWGFASGFERAGGLGESVA